MPTIADFKKFEKDFNDRLRQIELKRETDNRTFKARNKAGAFLTHDILGDRKGLTARKKLVMAYGFQGLTKEYDLAALHKMAEATEKAQDKFKSREAGIPINQAIQGSGAEDKRAAKAIKAATLYKFTGNILDFRVTSSGQTPNAPSYYKVRVRLEDWKTAVSRVKAKNYLSAAQQATSGYVSFDCDCGRYIYWYQYLATIGNFDIAPGETVFPKIRNKKLKGIACKHILKALMTLQSPALQGRIAQEMQTTAKNKDFDKADEVRLTAKELKDMEKAGMASKPSQAEFKRFVSAVKAFQEVQKRPTTKKAQADLQAKEEKKMQELLAEKEQKFRVADAAARKLKKDVDLAKMGQYMALKIYRDKLTKEQAVSDYAKDSGISLAEAQEMSKGVNI